MSRLLHRRRFVPALLLPLAMAQLLGGASPAGAAGSRTFNANITLTCAPSPAYDVVLTLSGTAPATTSPGEPVQLTGLTAKLRVLEGTVLDWEDPRGSKTLLANVEGLSLEAAGASPAALPVGGLPAKLPPVPHSTGGWGPASIPVSGISAATTAGSEPVTFRVRSFSYAGLLRYSDESWDVPFGPASTCTPAAGQTAAVVIPSTVPVPGAPVITSVSPGSGPVSSGGNVVTIKGSGFTRASGVLLRGGWPPATDVTVLDDETIRATLPDLRYEQYVNLQVVTDYGLSDDTPADDYLFGSLKPTPTITSITPASGPIIGGNTVTIRGTGFRDVRQVFFRGDGNYASGRDLTINAAGTEIAMPARPNYAPDTTSGGAGTVDVSVLLNGVCDGSCRSADTPADDYTYLPGSDEPVITSITPTTVQAGSVVTVRGDELDATTSIVIAGQLAAFTVVSPGELRVTVPAGPVDGEQVRLYLRGFFNYAPEVPDSLLTYGPAAASGPLVTSVVGNAWGAVGGLLRVRGSGLAGAKFVTLGTKKVRPLLVLGSTDVLVLAPPLPKGRYPVAVGNATAVSPAASRATINYR